MTKQKEHSIRTALNDLKVGALSIFARLILKIPHLYSHQATIKRNLKLLCQSEAKTHESTRGNGINLAVFPRSRTEESGSGETQTSPLGPKQLWR
jgi:hypothetical protein